MENFVFHPDYILKSIPTLLRFLPVTLGMALAAAVLGLLLGALLAKAKLSRRRLPRALANGYTTMMRCTPTIVLLFVVYYGLPPLLIQLLDVNIQSVPSVLFAVASLSLLFAGTSSELLRAAYMAVDKGQREAALAMGLSPWQAFYRIVLPQCVRIIAPNLALSLLALTKEVSLAFTIGVVDLMGKARLMIANNYNAMSLEIYIAVALIYWLISFVLQLAAQAAEGRKQARQYGHAA